MIRRNAEIDWSESYLLRSGHHLQVGRRPGVYRIRAFSPEGRPVTINRVKSADLFGILHIGQSIRLGVRSGSSGKRQRACEFSNMRAGSFISGVSGWHFRWSFCGLTMCLSMTAPRRFGWNASCMRNTDVGTWIGRPSTEPRVSQSSGGAASFRKTRRYVRGVQWGDFWIG